MNYGNAFNLTMYLQNESDYIVWSRVASSIAYVRDMLSNDNELYKLFQVRKELNYVTKNTLVWKFMLLNIKLNILIKSADFVQFKLTKTSKKSWLSANIFKCGCAKVSE